MSTLTVLSNRLKDQLKRLSPTLLRLTGTHLLTKEQTSEFMRPYQLGQSVKPPVTLERVTDTGDPQKELFHTKIVQTDPDFVWEYPNVSGKARLLRSGNIRIEGNILDTDFGNHALLLDSLKPDRRPRSHRPLIIAPWSHYWKGYFDYTVFVVCKLARIKTVLSPSQFETAVVSYPLLGTSYEKELLSLLGIHAHQLVDSREKALLFDRCIVANNSSWFYPASADVLALKTIVEAQLPPQPDAPRKRLYISRVGRRQVTNEAELVVMLRRYDFEIIEDIPRSVAEQVALYQRASFILGPHGASFANLIWCRPGTQLLELFPPSYRPEYFRYLAQVLQLRYAAYSFGPPLESHYSFLTADVYVDVTELEQGLVRLLAE